MKYIKPALALEQQADQLIRRGLVGDRGILIDRLSAVNYYRLSGYLFPYRQPDDTFRPGTTLDEVWNRYTFDRRLRLLIMDPIERIEVHVRTALVYRMAHATGPFGYTEP
jgi:abortive infection bacteriophage resistance protein